jgi:hypothetical protein
MDYAITRVKTKDYWQRAGQVSRLILSIEKVTKAPAD